MGGGVVEVEAARPGAEALRAALERALRSGRWAPGERLPTERALSENYGVARNTLRRALDALEAQGLIRRHVGRGTFRAEQDPAEPAPTEAGALSPAEVMECRLIFEPELLPMVVARANQADLQRLEECLRGAEAAGDLAAFEHWDAALHDAVALATHNQAAITLSRSLARVRLQTDWGQLKARGATPARRAALQAQHRALVAAIRDRDRVEARRLMREHILFVQGYMFGE
ncbi:FadR/GntR family transcriptional regulator [Roseomonas sp. BN140053]|uniref:FadR/GntR family transcriptional regulator n=1 Tax=Roseomonas sp. BN140053 TaxID=3391898 RepID=UPI0039ED2AA2